MLSTVSRRAAESGIDVETSSNNDVKIFIDAASRGDVDAITALLESGVDINGQDDKGATALMRAVEAGHPDAVKLLLDRGADVHIQGRFLGYSAIMFAVKNRNDNILEMLLAAANSKPSELSFATGVAQLSGNPRLIELLREAAAKWNDAKE